MPHPNKIFDERNFYMKQLSGSSTPIGRPNAMPSTSDTEASCRVMIVPCHKTGSTRSINWRIWSITAAGSRSGRVRYFFFLFSSFLPFSPKSAIRLRNSRARSVRGLVNITSGSPSSTT